MGSGQDDAYYAEEFERDQDRMQEVSRLERLMRETTDETLLKVYREQHDYLMAEIGG